MKILFVVNGLGLGNSTRSHAIMQHLRGSDALIEVVTSGNGLWYFDGCPEVSAVHEIESFAYGAKDGAISIGRTLASIRGLLAILYRNTRRLGDILDAAGPDVVVTDSDYNFLPLKRRRIPVVALNNADIVWQSYFRFRDRPASIRPQFFAVEMPDFMFHRLVPDLVISPSLDPGALPGHGKIHRVGPIVRRDFPLDASCASTNTAAVMLSGSIFGTPVEFRRPSYPVRIDVIGRDAPEGRRVPEAVTFHGKVKDSLTLLKTADLAVVNGGFSAVSEIFWMRKPLVVVPVPGHAEQWINARTIEHLGVGIMATPDSYEDAMLAALSRLGGFRENYQRLGPPKDGAAQAAQAIIELVTRRG